MVVSILLRSVMMIFGTIRLESLKVTGDSQRHAIRDILLMFGLLVFIRIFCFINSVFTRTILKVQNLYTTPILVIILILVG